MPFVGIGQVSYRLGEGKPDLGFGSEPDHQFRDSPRHYHSFDPVSVAVDAAVAAAAVGPTPYSVCGDWVQYVR